MTDPVFPATLASQFASAPVSRHFADAALIHAMGRFEAALALAQAEVGLVPAEAAHRIAQTCAALARPAAEADDAFAPQRLAAAARLPRRTLRGVITRCGAAGALAAVVEFV